MGAAFDGKHEAEPDKDDEDTIQSPRQENEDIVDQPFNEKGSTEDLAEVAEQQQVEDEAPAADPNDEALVNRLIENDTPYSVFTTPQKRWIVFAAAMASFFSPLSSSIYFPSIATIANDLGVDTTQINLTVTLYLVMQGVSSLLVAPFSDNLGRRPAYIISFIIFMGANLGLGLQNSFVALLLLRMLQSLGASGTISLAQGVTGDVVTSAERGSYIAIVSIPQVAAPVVAPILGGLLGQYLGWHSVFWFLLIASGVLAVTLVVFLPETCRRVVGDGSLPKPLINMSVWDAIKRVRTKGNHEQRSTIPLHSQYRLRDINPLLPLKAFLDVESVIVLLGSALMLALVYAQGTVFSDIFGRLYGFNTLQVSLMFIPLGVGAIVSSYTTGKLIDWNYRRHARNHNMPLTRNRQYDLSNFNIERPRLEIALPLMLLTVISTIAFGWVTNQKVNLAGPIIVLFISGYGWSAAFQTLNVLMIDVYPAKPATITAAGNLARSEIGAAASAAIAPMIQAMGEGWAFTVLAFIFLAYTPLLLLVMVRGMKWRQAKAKRSKKG
ncbi:hypothetical protein PRZ48_008301 [Zasmidium cellare]|uniref:Major facilitator superfamily (MFS) profile domain-containing protein n=1 Tax=Zasmidium cellare TaxID=395010 RepID=A0ABR0EG48_ZASCE|nr:hypothetical protein PRZ48_008301 [Zasmidium cellare]